MIRVLIVDDSGFMRLALRKIIEADGDIEVVGEARDGAEAMEMIATLRPDIVSLDVELPGIDGIAVLGRLAERPDAPPVVLVSSFTQTGAEVTIRGLAAGAVDFVSKSSSVTKTDLSQLDRELRPKLRQWAGHRRPAPARPAPASEAAASEAAAALSVDPALRRKPRGAPDLVVVAASTGGPHALPTLLKAAGPLPCAMVIAQHMPDYFTASFAQHLAKECGLDVRVGAHDAPLEPGQVALAPGGRDSIVARRPGGGLSLRHARSDGPYHPCADDLFRSAALAADDPVGVILTGMGADGSDGARALAKRAAPVLVQDPATCVVGGMPGAAIKAGVASESLSLEEIGRRLGEWCRPRAAAG